MKDKFKQELDEIEGQGIISKYDGRDISPKWLNCFVIVKKPNGTLRICLDPTDLIKTSLDQSATEKQWMMLYKS